MFKLDFPIKASESKINIKDAIYLVGSCFSDEFGALLKTSKFTSFSNPLGTIYNPYSIFKILKGEIDPTKTVQSSGVYYHWDSHGQVSGLEKDETSALLKARISASNEFLTCSKWLIITFGTAWAYRLKETNELVANCHKVPNANFTKELLPVDLIVDEFEETKSIIHKKSPDLKVILTVSPVRHTKDGLEENNRSKARLIEAVHQITERHDQVQYFPSYEIVMDELRDYRYFTEDLVHPTSQAIQYVWKRFSETYFDQNTTDFLKEWSKITTALNHRPFQPKSTEHQKFLFSTLEKLKALNEKVDMGVEIEQVKAQML